MVRHLGAVCRLARRGEHELRQGEPKILLVYIAATLGKSEPTLSRFEAGKVEPTSIDAVVDAYSEVLNLDAFDIWLAAVNRWSEHHKRDVGAAESVVQAVTAATQAERHTHARSARKRSSKATKPAATSDNG